MRKHINPARLLVLSAALSAIVAMVASLLTLQAQRAHNATQLPAQCLGYMPLQLSGTTLLVPVDLCDPSNRDAIQRESQQQQAPRRQPNLSA